MNVLISYHHNDDEAATKLKSDLESQYIGIWIDKQSLKPGGQWLKDIDKGLSKDVDYVLGIVTKTYLDSFGGVEAYAALSDSLSTGNRKFLPLYFVSPKEVDSNILKSVTGFVLTDYGKGLFQLIKFFKSEEKENPSELLSHIEGEHSQNPFRRTRAEFFENEQKLALAFATPEKERYELIRGRTPLFIFGGRGSGKTMALKYLTTDVLLPRYSCNSFQELKNKGVDYFGIYLRLLRGSFSLTDSSTILELGFKKTGITKDYKLYLELTNKYQDNPDTTDPIISAGISAARLIFLHELNLKLLSLFIVKLLHYREQSILIISAQSEQNILLDIRKAFGTDEQIHTFTELITFVDTELNKIKKYLQRIMLPNDDVLSTDWIETSHDFIDAVCLSFQRNISELDGIKIYLMLDEYENLFSYQQMIVNEWIKTANCFVVKVGSKFEGMHTNMTLQGQPLQFKVGECEEISLDYNLFNDSDMTRFKSLLRNICSNILEIEDYREKNIEQLLEEPTQAEIPQETIDEFIAQMIGKKITEDNLKEYRNKYEVAAIFRALRERGKVKGRKSRGKVYAGFDTFTYLSSGIIRVFLNLVGMAFYRAEGMKVSVKDSEKIPVDAQSWAARIVSKGYLEKIHKNIESFGGVNGEMLYQFVTDIGDIFRERLLYHTSEPETLSISLSDPHQLGNNPSLSNFLKHGVKESILYKREETSSKIPKKATAIRPKEFVLNRIYTPALEISHRARWGRCHFATQELIDLIAPEKREVTKKMLQQRQRKEKSTLFK